MFLEKIIKNSRILKKNLKNTNKYYIVKGRIKLNLAKKINNWKIDNGTVHWENDFVNKYHGWVCITVTLWHIWEPWLVVSFFTTTLVYFNLLVVNGSLSMFKTANKFKKLFVVLYHASTFSRADNYTRAQNTICWITVNCSKTIARTTIARKTIARMTNCSNDKLLEIQLLE